MTFPLPPLQEPDIIRAIRQFQDGLFYMEQSQSQMMVAQWLRMENLLAGEIEALAYELALIRQAGGTVEREQVLKLQRYRRLIGQIRVEMRRYVDFAAREIARQQQLLIALGLGQSEDIVRRMLNSGGIYVGFDVLPVSALEAMVGIAGDGSPLSKLLAAAFPDSVEGLTNALVDAILKGTNPRETAQLMKNGFGIGLNRALNIARTEQLRAYREASRLNYERSGVVEGYKRLSARDARTCPACLMADNGVILPLGYAFDAHPQCRCTLVPVVRAVPVVEWQTGPSWFLGLPAAAQVEILGPGRFDAWQGGLFDLGQLVTRKVDATWGGSLVTTPLRELVGNG